MVLTFRLESWSDFSVSVPAALTIPLWSGEGWNWPVHQCRPGLVPGGAQEPGLLPLHQAAPLHQHWPHPPRLVSLLGSFSVLWACQLQSESLCVFQVCWSWVRCSSSYWKQTHASAGATACPRHGVWPGGVLRKPVDVQHSAGRTNSPTLTLIELMRTYVLISLTYQTCSTQA